MSLDKAIAHGKEKRKPYRGAKAIDGTCRNHGSCLWCRENRTHRFRDKENDAMRVETTYYAFDEKEFDSKENCLAYEAMVQDKLKSVVFLDDDFDRMDGEDPAYVAESAVYVKILNGEKASELVEWLEEYTGVCFDGIEDIETGDIFVFDMTHGAWYNLTDRISELKEMESKINESVSDG